MLRYRRGGRSQYRRPGLRSRSISASAAHRRRRAGMYDLLIRGATVVDGLGHDPRRADVAISNSRIAAIGEIGSGAAEVIDARGLALVRGIIDIHTHYDAQVTWDPTLSPSPSLGVTTAVMGNCGFGIVPSPPPIARPHHAQPRGRRRHGSRRP